MTAVEISAERPVGLTARRTLQVLAPFLELRTWGALAYVWIGFPLGLAWFVLLVVGFVAGVPLTLVWVGLLVLFLTFLAAWGAAGLERRLAMALLGARIGERRRRPEGPETWRGWLASVFFSPELWKGLLFLAVRFPLALAGWVFSVVSLALSVALLAAPFAVAFDWGVVRIDSWTADRMGHAAIAAVLGFVLLVATLHVHRAIGWGWARLAELLLGPAPIDSRHGASDRAADRDPG